MSSVNDLAQIGFNIALSRSLLLLVLCEREERVYCRPFLAVARPGRT
jgi:hypothetical protein